MVVKIRKPDNVDYNEVKKMLQKLHDLHSTYRPDIYADKEIKFSIHDFNTLIEEETSIILLAETEDNVVGHWHGNNKKTFFESYIITS